MKTSPLTPSRNIFKRMALGSLALVVGAERTKVLKQKLWLMRKQKPPLVVTSREERAIFEGLKDRFHTVFEVGIQKDLSFVKMKKDCAYHLFEPNAKFVRSIRKQLASMPGYDVRLNEFGLSDQRADDRVYFEKSQSFMVNENYADGDIDTGKRYSLRTLDEYVAENRIAKIDLLKIDTEGFDYNVIKGGMKTIRSGNVSYIQFEYWDTIRKFIDLLGGAFTLYMIVEPRLLKTILEKVRPAMTPEEKRIDFTRSLVPLDAVVARLLDDKIGPTGAGCNVFGVSKDIKADMSQLTVEVQPQR